MQSAIENITYAELVDRFGNDNALVLVRTVEKLAQVRDDIIFLDQNMRFQNALEALDKINFA